MKTKRIERYDLNTLSSKFETLSDHEKGAYTGGAFYYDTNGTFIGKYGDSDTVEFSPITVIFII